MKECYHVVKRRYVTEKSNILSRLHKAESNPSLKACQSPKEVFIVDDQAGKKEIAQAVEAIYKERNVKVIKVNTLRMKPKYTARGRGKGRKGKGAGFKKAIVTFQVGDVIDNV